MQEIKGLEIPRTYKFAWVGDSGHKIILISCCSSTVTSNYYEEVAA